MAERNLPSENLVLGERYKNLNTSQVMEYIGVTCRSSVWLYVKEGKLPKPRYISPKNPVWRLGEVIDHLEGVYVSFEEGAQGVGAKGLTDDGSAGSSDRKRTTASLKDRRKAESTGLAQKLREKLNLGGLGRKKP
jgi:predicted DNA-binding transcriptional regulator AlpA